MLLFSLVAWQQIVWVSSKQVNLPETEVKM